MDFIKYLTLLVVFFCDVIESGGHGGSHDHIKLYVPEFHHHKHHTKYVTIHHHHKKPKKEQHHHHIHIPKSHPLNHYGHYHRTKKGHKTTLKTTTTHVGSGLGHGHHGHSHHHHHDPSSNYETPVYGDHFSSQAAPHVVPFSSIPHIPSAAKVRGISHTVKQLKVFDSLPGATPGGNGDKGYEVNENSEEEEEEDSFTAVNNIHDVYPPKFNFLQSASANTGNDAFESFGNQGQSHVPFVSGKQLVVGTDSFMAHGGGQNYDGFESFDGLGGGHELPSLSDNGDFQPIAHEIPVSFGGEEEAFEGTENSFTSGAGIGHNTYLSGNEKFGFEDAPVSFAREAGVQRTEDTGGQYTAVY